MTDVDFDTQRLPGVPARLQTSTKSQVTASHDPAWLKYVVLGFGGRLPGKGPIYRDLAGQPTLPLRSGGRLITADRFYPSSKTCLLGLRDSESQTIPVRAHLAINLLALAASGAESLNAWEGCVRPGPAGRRPPNQEPGTAHAGKTGTAAGQPAAAGSEFTL